MSLVGTGLEVDIAGRTIFHDVDVEVPQGSSLALVGPSGSGKTTLLNCLGLLQRPSRGEVSLDGHTLTGQPQREVLRFWREKAAFVYQDSGVIDEETLAYNVTLSQRRARREGVSVEKVLDEVGLSGRAEDRAAVLSGGEKQRLGLARAIYKQALVIYADEPTASLDQRNRALVRDLLLGRTERGVSVIVATHDLELARACDATLELA